MSLDLAVARVIMRARVLEHALHASSAEWNITVGDTVVSANRTVLNDRIVFSALFPEQPDGDFQTLSHNGVPMTVRPFTDPGFAPFIVDWALVLPEEDPARV
jgi:hypothetical protein